MLPAKKFSINEHVIRKTSCYSSLPSTNKHKTFSRNKNCDSHNAGRRSTEAFSALPRTRRAYHTAAVITKTQRRFLIVPLYFPIARPPVSLR